jgi:hypothetical protein
MVVFFESKTEFSNALSNSTSKNTLLDLSICINGVKISYAEHEKTYRKNVNSKSLKLAKKQGTIFGLGDEKKRLTLSGGKLIHKSASLAFSSALFQTPKSIGNKASGLFGNQNTV